MEDLGLPAIQKSYDLNRWLLGRVERMPRTWKFTLGDRLQTAAIDLNRALVEAAHAKSGERALFRASRLLEQLRLLVRLASDVGALSSRQYEFVARNNDEVGRMIGGWLRYTRANKRGNATSLSTTGA